MSTSGNAAVLNEISGEFSIQQVEVEAPRDDEVLIEISACGICHTDLVIRHGALPVPTPVVLGHEGAGHIVSVGTAVTNVKVGDPVILSYSSCGNCVACESHETPYCHEFVARNFGASRPDGSTAFSTNGEKIHSHFFGQSSFSTHVVTPIRNVVKAPSDIALDILAPLGCGIQTGAGSILNELNVKTGSVVLVLGAGAVGMSAIMAARIAGAQTIIALDLSVTRLALAKELGASHCLLGDGRSVRGLVAAYPHGQMMQVDFATMMLKGQRVQGIVEGSAVPQDFIPELISYYRQGQFPFDRLIEHFDFTDINRAIKACESGNVIKPVLRMN